MLFSTIHIFVVWDMSEQIDHIDHCQIRRDTHDAFRLNCVTSQLTIHESCCRAAFSREQLLVVLFLLLDVFTVSAVVALVEIVAEAFHVPVESFDLSIKIVNLLLKLIQNRWISV